MRSKAFLLTGLLAAAAALAGCEGDELPDDDDDGTTDPGASRLYWPFLDVTIVQGQPYTFFVQWPVPSAVDAPERPERLGLNWLSNRSGFWSDFADDATFTFGNLTVTAVPASAGPRFGVDGYNATAVLIYAFTEDGRLVAHTESPPLELSELARVPWTNTESAGNVQLPVQLDYETWYLGAAEEAPPGTVKPPSLVDPYKEALAGVATGLPVGGAASVIVPEDEWEFGFFFGDLYVTAQIVTLVHAP